MKNFLFVANLMLLVTLFNCGSKTQATTENDLLVVPDEVVSGLCLWKEVAIRETPSEKGKFITTVYRGETFTLTGDTASESVNDKDRQYHQVKLSDRTEGWMRTEFLAINGVPATFVTTSNIFKRPNEMTETLKVFDMLDFVAIMSTTGSDWCEVKGKPVGQKWFSVGWVKCQDLSRKEEDIRYSMLYIKAMENDDSVKREAEITNLLSMDGFKESPFYTALSLGDSFGLHANEEYDSLN
jgi:hypothetical protein